MKSSRLFLVDLSLKLVSPALKMGYKDINEHASKVNSQSNCLKKGGGREK